MKSLSKQNLMYTLVITALLAGSLFVWFLIVSAEVENPYAVIYKNGMPLKREWSLSGEYEIETNGNTILVKDGSIGVVSASCPDQICVNTGFISAGIIPIVCLPNTLEIRIYGMSDEGVDAVAR